MSSRFDRYETNVRRYLTYREEWAAAKAEKEKVMNMKAVVVSMAMREAEREGHKTIAAQEREAYLSEHYSSWVDDAFEATKNEAMWAGKVKSLEIWFDGVRTEEATRREEMRLAR